MDLQSGTLWFTNFRLLYDEIVCIDSQINDVVYRWICPSRPKATVCRCDDGLIKKPDDFVHLAGLSFF